MPPTAAVSGSTEPRMIPGLLLENEKRRSRRISSSGMSELATSAEMMIPGLATLAVPEDEEVDQGG